MYKKVLSSLKNLGNEQKEDSKSESFGEGTNMDFIRKHRDFSRTSQKDLESAFSALRSRCPETWNQKLEKLANELHKNVTTLKSENLTKYVDPEFVKPNKNIELDSKHSARDLIIAPQVWDMTKEKGIELRELLHHFTVFAPFEGRPFVRAWLEALVPCFSRWILLSNTGDGVVIYTLKRFMAAFGQPGIVVCLADKGEKILRSLKDSARSVEALGRGTVEGFYWKRLAESSFDEETAWRQLANIGNKPLVLSQLDTLPKNWLMDSSDWVHVFANIVSPKISDCFETLVQDILNESKLDDIAQAHPGPPKTLARSIAKSQEYMADFNSSKNEKRWRNFIQKFKSIFKREPNRSEDFVWNIVDFARCSIVVPTARHLLKVKQILEQNEKLSVVCVKNGYKSDYRVKGSGYRDMKLLVKVEFNELGLNGITKFQQKTTMICEIQLLCNTWLENKKTTSLSYKVLRANKLKDFFSDFSKYLGPIKGDISTTKFDAIKVLKNGWVNLAKVTDFTNIDSSKLLMDSAQNGWEVAGIEILVKQLGANLEFKDTYGRTSLVWATDLGHIPQLKSLIGLKADIEECDWEMTALQHAVRSNQEEALRVLLAAGAIVGARRNDGRTTLEYARKHASQRIQDLLIGKKVPRLKSDEKKMVSIMDKAKTAAIECSLTDFFDFHELLRVEVSQLFASQAVATSVENILQLLWFGADVDSTDHLGFTALCHAAQNGTNHNLKLLLKAGANVHIRDGIGWGPLHLTVQNGTLEMITTILESKADIEYPLSGGWTPLLSAVECRSSKEVLLLLEAKADLSKTLDRGTAVKTIARRNHANGEEILRVINEWKTRN